MTDQNNEIIQLENTLLIYLIVAFIISLLVEVGIGRCRWKEDESITEEIEEINDEEGESFMEDLEDSVSVSAIQEEEEAEKEKQEEEETEEEEPADDPFIDAEVEGDEKEGGEEDGEDDDERKDETEDLLGNKTKEIIELPASNQHLEHFTDSPNGRLVETMITLPDTRGNSILSHVLQEETSEIYHFDSIYEEKDLIVNKSDLNEPPLLTTKQINGKDRPSKAPLIYCSYDPFDTIYRDKVLQISKMLRRHGFLVYVDEDPPSTIKKNLFENEDDHDQNNGYAADEMKEEILQNILRQSSCVLLFLTTSYQVRVNSLNVFDIPRFEFIQSFKLQLPIIPILLDETLQDRQETWKNRFGVYLEDFPVLNVSTKEMIYFESSLSIHQKIWKYLIELIHTVIRMDEEDEEGRSLTTRSLELSVDSLDLSDFSLAMTSEASHHSPMKSSTRRKRDRRKLLVLKAAEEILALKEYCSYHPEKDVQYYDTDCQQLLCATCYISHEGHNVLSEEQYQQQRKKKKATNGHSEIPKEMTSTIDLLPEVKAEEQELISSCINKITALERNSSSYLEKLSTQRALTEAAIHQQFQQILDQLQRKKEELQKDIQVFYQKKEKHFYQELDHYSDQKQSLIQLLQEYHLYQWYQAFNFHQLKICQECQQQSFTANTLITTLDFKYDLSKAAKVAKVAKDQVIDAAGGEIEKENGKENESSEIILSPVTLSDLSTLQSTIALLGKRHLEGSILIQEINEEQCLINWLRESLRRSSLSSSSSFYPSSFQLELLYRSDRDGWKLEQFHQKCDDQGSTLLIIESMEGYLFGAYSAVPYSSPDIAEYLTDITVSSFLFTLKNPHRLGPIKLPLITEKATEAVVIGKEYGPTFGAGNDFYIVNDMKEVSFLPFQSYEDTSGEVHYNERIFAGQTTVKVKAIEIWKVIVVDDGITEKGENLLPVAQGEVEEEKLVNKVVEETVDDDGNDELRNEDELRKGREKADTDAVPSSEEKPIDETEL